VSEKKVMATETAGPATEGRAAGEWVGLPPLNCSTEGKPAQARGAGATRGWVETQTNRSKAEAWLSEEIKPARVEGAQVITAETHSSRFAPSST